MRQLELQLERVELEVAVEVVAAYEALATAEMVRQELRRQMEAVVVDIPVWWESRTFHGASFLKKIAVVADEIVVMAYDRPADRVIDDVAEEMALTAALGKRMWIGVRAKREDFATGDGLQPTESRLEELLSKIAEAYGGRAEPSRV